MRVRAVLRAYSLASALGSALACGVPRGVVTQHNDAMRTGAYLSEHTLTPSAVSTRGMRLAYWRPVDDNINAQLLYVPRVRTGWRKHDIVYTVTRGNRCTRMTPVRSTPPVPRAACSGVPTCRPCPIPSCPSHGESGVHR